MGETNRGVKLLCISCWHRIWNAPLDHTCGIYSSPNIETLIEYVNFPNSITVLLNLYGTADIWSAPRDIPGCYVVRSWGAKIVGIQHEEKSSQRYQAVILAAQYFGVQVYPARMLRDMIQVNWIKEAQIDPFKKEKK